MNLKTVERLSPVLAPVESRRPRVNDDLPTNSRRSTDHWCEKPERRIVTRIRKVN